MLCYPRAHLCRLAAVGLTSLMMFLALPAAADAHVVVDPNAAAAGSFPVLSFRVPDESAKAKTVAVTVRLPIDHPFASVTVHRQIGWTATVARTELATPITDDDGLTVTEAVTSITWRADPTSAVPLGEYAQFDVSVGPVPDVAAIAFPTVQTYDDGSVVDWDEPTPASGAEPEHPVPALHVSPALAPDAARLETTGVPAGTMTAGVPADTEPTGAPADRPIGSPSPASPVTVTATTVTASAPDSTARGLAAIALVVAAAGLLVGALGVRRRSR